MQIPMVFAGIYPIDSSEFELLDKAMSKVNPALSHSYLTQGGF